MSTFEFFFLKYIIYSLFVKSNSPEAILPTLRQSQSLLSNNKATAKSGTGSNSIGEVTDFLEQFIFNKETADTEPDRPFCYEPQIQTGTDNNHTFLFLTSKTLLCMATNSEAIYHIDCTYKIVVNRFPVLIFGRSDLSGQFFPMVVCLMSHETTEDFSMFYRLLKSVLHVLFEIDFKPTFIMQDAQDACWAAGKSAFPSCLILVCYFHVVKNVKTRIADLRKQKKFTIEQENSVIKAIQHLHFTSHQSEFEIELFHTLEYWKSLGVVNEFIAYFLSEWVYNERWNTWKVCI